MELLQAFFDVNNGSTYRAIQDALLTHVADPRRYRMAVLDAPPDVTPNQMRDLRGLVGLAGLVVKETGGGGSDRRKQDDQPDETDQQRQQPISP